MVYVYVPLGGLIPRLCEAGMGMRLVVGVANLSSCLQSNDNGKSLREGPLCLRYNRRHLHTHAGKEENTISKCPVQVYWFLFAEAKKSTPLTAMVLLWDLTKVV